MPKNSLEQVKGICTKRDVLDNYVIWRVLNQEEERYTL